MSRFVSELKGRGLDAVAKLSGLLEPAADSREDDDPQILVKGDRDDSKAIESLGVILRRLWKQLQMIFDDSREGQSRSLRIWP